MSANFKPPTPPQRPPQKGGSLQPPRPPAAPSKPLHAATPPAAVPRPPQAGGRLTPPPRPAAPPQRAMPSQPAPLRPAAPNIKQALASHQPPPAKVGVIPPRPAQTPTPAATAAVAGLVALNTAAAHPDLSSDASSLNNDIQRLQERAAFGSVASSITSLDNTLRELADLTASARSKGYLFQSDLDNTVYQLQSQWESVRPQVYEQLQKNAHMMQSQLPLLNPHIQQLNFTLGNPLAARPILQTARSQVSAMLNQVDQIEHNLESGYATIETEAASAKTRLTRIHWAMDQLAEAKFSLGQGEALVMAVKARWDKQGKEDPEGILFLTNKRLIFERKEKVATKKVLFITTAAEMVQEVLIDQPLTDLRSIRAENKGLFGHQDFLQVEFADPRLGEVALHIDGQDSKDWAGLIEKCRSGKIEQERAGQAGISIADLTRPLTPGDIVTLQSEVALLQDDMLLKDVRAEMVRLENEVGGLGRKLSNLRAKGYAMEKDLEANVLILTTQWERIKSNTDRLTEQQTQLLSSQMTTIQQTMAQLVGMSANLNAAKPLYMQLKSAMASAKAQADAAHATVAAQYSLYANEVDGLSARFDWIEWMLEALATASFRLLATESGIAATEAALLTPDWEIQENGILFLTDQRVLWEDRVGDYELKVNVPLQDVQKVEHSSKTNEDGSQSYYLSFDFGAKGPYPTTHFLLPMPVGEEWCKMVGRARSGEYAAGRAVQIDPAEIERIKNAPQQCPQCGGAFTAPILHGQTEIVCEYCGLATRF